jgi:hypothetical protein
MIRTVSIAKDMAPSGVNTLNNGERASARQTGGSRKRKTRMTTDITNVISEHLSLGEKFSRIYNRGACAAA